MKNKKTAILILRIALAFSFIYAAISSFISPQNWIGFIPEFLPGNFITDGFILFFFSIYEVALGIWLLSNKKLYYSAIFASTTLALITLTNFSQTDIIFRDISLFLTAVALSILAKK
ncbi:MAG: hypothetical protein QW727_02835 [Candidatus Pacearchaeota archaeon]